MQFISRNFIRIREGLVRFGRGQTMTEYAMILGALALVVYGTYQQMGKDVGRVVTVIGDLAEDAGRAH